MSFSSEDSWIRKKPLGHISEPHKPLVKKTMIEHMKEGKRMLEEQEKLHHEQEEIEKQLGEYTIADLHKNLEDVTTVSKGDNLRTCKILLLLCTKCGGNYKNTLTFELNN